MLIEKASFIRFSIVVWITHMVNIFEGAPLASLRHKVLARRHVVFPFVSGPGVTPDRRAIRECGVALSMGNWTER